MSSLHEPEPASVVTTPRSRRVPPELLKAVPIIVAAGVGGAIITWALLILPSTTAVDTPPAEPAAPMKVNADGLELDRGAPQWKYIDTGIAELAPALAPLPVLGRVTFDERRTANVGTPMAGRIDTVLVRAGDDVKRGDKLFSVKSGVYADLDREIASAREEVAVKKRLYERAKDMLELKAISEKDVLVAEAELKEAELNQRAAEAKQASLSVGAAGSNLFWVVAPRDGTVVSLDVYAGQEVTSESSEPLLRISDLAEVLVLADVPETSARDVTAGAEVSVVASDGSFERAGVVEHVSQIVDPQRQTVPVRLRVPNADRQVRPNAFVEVQMASRPDLKRVQVVDDAVVTEGSDSYVFVDNGNGKLSKVKVVPGRRRDNKVELLSGLEPGAHYVSKGALLVLNQVDLAD